MNYIWDIAGALLLIIGAIMGAVFGIKGLLLFIKGIGVKASNARSVMNTVDTDIVDKQAVTQGVVNRITAHLQSDAYAVRSTFGVYGTDYILKSLKDQGFQLDTTSSICSLNKDYCSTITKITKGKVVAFLGINWSKDRLLDSKGRRRYVSDNIDLADYTLYDSESDERLIVGNYVSLAFASDDENSDEVTAIHNTIVESELDQPHYEVEKVKNTFETHRLYENKYSGFGLSTVIETVVPLSRKMLDLSYPKVNYELEGERYSFGMSGALGVMEQSLLLGENVAMYGAAGTGKTELINQILYRLDQNNKLKLIRLTAADLQVLATDTKAISSLRGALMSNKSEKPIFVIDEAERLLVSGQDGVHTLENSIILQMMSGSIQKELNCQVILAFNADLKSLNPAIFRKGRCNMVIELTALPKEQAINLARELKKLQPEKIFDEVGFIKTVDSPNFNTKGEKYANPKFITLGDVYDSFIHEVKFTAIRSAIQAATGKTVSTGSKDLHKKVKPSQASVPKVPVAVEGPSESKNTPTTKTGGKRQRKR